MAFYLVPHWFFGIDAAIEIVYALLALSIAYLAYKAYRVAEEPSLKYWAIGFASIGLSYLVWAGTNLLIVDSIRHSIRDVAPTICMGCLRSFSFSGLYGYAALFTIGLASLVYATLNIRKLGVYYLLLGLSLTVLAVSVQKFATSKIVAFFFLTFMLYNYATRYNTLKRPGKYALAGFVLLLLSTIDFMFSPSHYLAYVAGHVLELGAYVLFVISLKRAFT